MSFSRREMMTMSGAAAAVLSSHGVMAQGFRKPCRKRMGVSIASYGYHRRQALTDHPEGVPFHSAIDFLEHCRKLGAGGVQTGITGWKNRAYGKRVREWLEAYDMYFEGQIRLPRDKSEIPEFERDIIAAKEAGVSVVRTVMLGGRRYETFKSLTEWEDFRRRSWQSLTLVEPIMARHKTTLAVENHKDWTLEEMVGLMKRISSEWVGVTLDTGNNISLLDDPEEVVDGLAPYAVTSHFKDMGVQQYKDGFLLSEVPLGSGFLDLKKMVRRLEKEGRNIQYNLEMITRDPLKVPVLTPQYWITLGDLRGEKLASMLKTVAEHSPVKPLPRVSHLGLSESVEVEQRQVEMSFAYWRQALGIS